MIRTCAKKPPTWYTLNNAAKEVPVVRGHGERHGVEALFEEGNQEVALNHDTGDGLRRGLFASKPLPAPVPPFARGVRPPGRVPGLAGDGEPPTPADRQEADPEAECRARDRRRG